MRKAGNALLVLGYSLWGSWESWEMKQSFNVPFSSKKRRNLGVYYNDKTEVCIEVVRQCFAIFEQLLVHTIPAVNTIGHA